MRYRASIVAMISAIVLMTTSTVGAISPVNVPRAVFPSSNRLTVVTALKTYVAWRIVLPTGGFVKATVVGADTGSGYLFLTDGGGAGGGASATNIGAEGVGVHEDVEVQLGNAGILMEPGEHLFVLIIGGGTVPAGVEVVHVSAPADATVVNATSGQAVQLADANFAGHGDLVVRTPVVGAASAHGYVRKTIRNSLFGLFWANPATSTASYLDPSGTTQAVPPSGQFWQGAPPGDYTLHIDEDIPPTVNPSASVQALFADVQIP